MKAKASRKEKNGPYNNLKQRGLRVTCRIRKLVCSLKYPTRKKNDGKKKKALEPEELLIHVPSAPITLKENVPSDCLDSRKKRKN